MTGLKISFPDCRWPDWPEKPIETSDSMQKVFKNSRQSFKKSDNFWEKYSSWKIPTIYVQSLCKSEWVSGPNYDARLGTGQVDRTSLWPECRKWIDKGRCSDMNDITRSRLCVDLCQRSLETSFISLMSTVPPVSNIIVWYFQKSMQLHATHIAYPPMSLDIIVSNGYLLQINDICHW